MEALRRALALTAVVAGGVYVSWLGFRVQTGGDYGPDFAPAMGALLSGHLGAFFTALPGDGAGGSVLLRAPAALLAKLLGGGMLEQFRLGALECVLACGALGLALARGMRRAGRPLAARVAVLGLCVVAPEILDAIRFGHPEEALGAALCAAAVLLAGADHAAAAGIAVGLAIINKPWAVLAVIPMLLAARGRRPVRRAAIPAAGIPAAWAICVYLGSPNHFWRSLSALSLVAHPVDVWWPLAHLHTAPGTIPIHLPPRLVGAYARELVVPLVALLSIPLLRRRERTTEDCLALLALAFLLRCLLDPSNHVYYQLPFLIALCGWEARARDWPMLALIGATGFYTVFHTVSGSASLNVQFAAYLAVALPLLGALAGPALGLGPRVSSRVDDRHRSRRELSGELARPA